LTSVKEFAAGVSLRNNLGEGVEHVGKAPDLDGTVGNGWVGEVVLLLERRGSAWKDRFRPGWPCGLPALVWRSTE